MTKQAADAAIDTVCCLLRLPTIRAEFPDIAAGAAKDRMTYRGFLAELLMAACVDRAPRRSETEEQGGQGPRKSLCDLRPRCRPHHRPDRHPPFVSREWIKKSQPLCLIGDSGSGKSYTAGFPT